jgi:hypothetical protein
MASNYNRSVPFVLYAPKVLIHHEDIISHTACELFWLE